MHEITTAPREVPICLSRSGAEAKGRIQPLSLFDQVSGIGFSCRPHCLGLFSWNVHKGDIVTVKHSDEKLSMALLAVELGLGSGNCSITAARRRRHDCGVHASLQCKS